MFSAGCEDLVDDSQSFSGGATFLLLPGAGGRASFGILSWTKGEMMYKSVKLNPGLKLLTTFLLSSKIHIKRGIENEYRHHWGWKSV